MKGDPTNPGSWSGVPSRLSGGLEAAGAEVVPVDVEVPKSGAVAHRLNMNWAAQAANPWFARAYGMFGSSRLRRAGRVDGVIMIGSGYQLHTGVPVVTFEDMTVAQAIQQDDPAYEGLGEKTVAGWQARQRKIYAATKACCSACHWAADSIRDDYGVPAEKLHVVGFGHNVEMEVPDRDWSVPRFIWVGADWRRKNGELIVDAFRTVRETHPEATLDFVGNHPELDAPGVTGHGRLALGSPEGQAEYLALLRQSTCYVMPSKNEPLGIAYIDAATAGVPSIGTTSGGAIDAIGDGGVVVDPGNSEQLLAAMLKLADPATARAMGDKARARSDLFTWRKVAERLIRTLEPRGVDPATLEPDLPAP
jgi:glycosyltransferase involved in cell wall biosynthesis